MVQVVKKVGLLHRSRVNIMANILQAANGGAKKTNILYECNLSFRQLRVYLDLLVDKGFLEVITQKEDKRDFQLFKTTSKGKAFIKAYDNLGLTHGT